MAKAETEIVRETVSLLDSVDYIRYSEGKASTYPEYVLSSWTDERKLIAPILFPKFAERVLGFTLGETMATQETGLEGKDIPDYIPVDTRTHPFVFDCKGMDTIDLSKWYGQIRRYLERQNLAYGILVNMRDLEVYTLESQRPLEGFGFSFVELHKAFKDDPSGILEKENTKRFLRFVGHFRHISLTSDQKLAKVTGARSWTGTETLNIELLTKRLRYIVDRITEDARSRKAEIYSLSDVDPQRATDIAREIELIASEIEQGKEREEAPPATLDAILATSSDSLLGKALELFLYRVGYFTMTRLLLARAWEDIGFIDQTLYDGGLARWYGNFNKEIRRVLKYAFDLAGERYRWLFNVDNNYTWYEPSDTALAEALYELSNFYLGRLDQDILGTIYEEYIDRIDKKRKGQYYTPREVVEFIWDRVGFKKDEAFFRYEGGRREPKLIFDPATGSGGFLVEAARRIREESRIDYHDFNDVLDLRTSILTGIFGSEISPFPYYITEVNLLVQLTPVIKRMMEMRQGFRGRGTPALGVVPVDSLSLYNPEQLPLEKEQYDSSQTRDPLPLESQKRTVFDKIKKGLDGRFSYCCANPPYVGEKGNKELFRATLTQFHYMRQFYQGKMDYFYFFVILGLSKLEEGGKLGFITTAYWPTADGASKLRKYILRNAKVLEFIFFEDFKIFEYAKGQHNMVFVLEKCSGDNNQAARDENRTKMVRVAAKHQEIPGGGIREKLRFLTEHIQNHISKDEWRDQYIEVYWSGVKQGELTEQAWDLRHDLSTDAVLNSIMTAGEKIGNFLHIGCGVLTNRDYVTAQNIKRLSPLEVDRYGIKVGDGIFVLSEQEYGNLALSAKEREIIKPWYKNSEVARYVPDRHGQRKYLIYLRNKDNPDEFPTIKSHLVKFKGILDYQRLEYGETNEWYAVTRASEDSVLKREKIFTPYRAETNTFAYSEADFFSSKDLYYITYKTEPQDVKESLRYVIGVLNSAVIEFWCRHKLKYKGGVREYYATPLRDIPIRRIDFANPSDVSMHEEIVKRVDEIRDRMAQLSAYSGFFKGTKLSRLKDADHLPALDSRTVATSLPPESRFSLRTHPEIRIVYGAGVDEAGFILTKIGRVSLTLEAPRLDLSNKDEKAIFLYGEETLLRIIGELLEERLGESWLHIKEEPVVPLKPTDLLSEKERILSKVSQLRSEIHCLQYSIDETVFKLYRLNETLFQEHSISHSEYTTTGELPKP